MSQAKNQDASNEKVGFGRRNLLLAGTTLAAAGALGLAAVVERAEAQPAAIAPNVSGPKTPITPAEAKTIAEEAYVFGFAIVEHYKALWAYGVEPKSPKYGGINKLRNEAQLYGPKDTAVVSANNDTIYTSGMIDLRTEPMVLQVPDISDRYYSFMLVDMVTDNFGYVGSRATGTKAGAYALTGPGWKGQLPKGVARIPSPSWIAFAIGRTGVSGDADLPKLREVQSGYKLTPLSEYTGTAAPAAAAKLDFPPMVDTKEADAATFIKYLNFQMQFHCFPAVEQRCWTSSCASELPPAAHPILPLFLRRFQRPSKRASMPAGKEFASKRKISAPRSTAGTFLQAMPANLARTSSRAPRLRGNTSMSTRR